jgi:glycosyltransferase involved in cell wall biosynthesis
MSVGKPAVVSNCVGNVSLIKNSENGLVFKMNDYEGLANCLKKILADDQFYVSLSRCSLRIFKNNFTADIMVKKIEKVYDSLF